MKKIYFTLCVMLMAPGGSFAQNDTLLWEDFEFPFVVNGTDTTPYIEIAFPDGDPQPHPTWLNFDVDGLADGSGADRPGEWFWSAGFADTTNGVYASSSWLDGFANGAENWLITPEIFIGDDQATLYWKSAPFQLPRYIDGYQVLISTNGNVETFFTDTIAVFAEFDGNLTTDIEDTATYVFTQGIMHTSMEPDTADHTRNRGVLQQWEASLAAYSGQTIQIAFRHRSDDDNLISIDDVLVTGNGSVGIGESLEALGLSVYPNPATVDSKLTVSYELKDLSVVSYSITDLKGSVVKRGGQTRQMAGSHRAVIAMDGLMAGNYLINLNVNNHTFAHRFVVSQ